MDEEKLKETVDIIKSKLEEAERQLEQMRLSSEMDIFKNGESLNIKIWKLRTELEFAEKTLLINSISPVATNGVIDLYKNTNIETYQSNQSYDNPLGYYIVCLHGTKTIIGEVGCNELGSRDPYNNVHYVISEQYRGNGYAEQAVCVLLNYLVEHGVEDVIILIEKDNIPSVKTAEKVINSMSNVEIEESSKIITYHIKLNKKVNKK